MNDYENITFWENVRRVKELEKFLNHVDDYFNDCRQDNSDVDFIEGEKAKHARSKINLMNVEIQKIIAAAGIDCAIQYIPPGVVGNHVHVGVLENIFNLSRFSITPNHVTGFLEQAMGVYQYDRRKSVCRTFNPFWWIGRFLYWFSRIPFNILKASGFNATKAEGSTLGRLVKAILHLIPIFASLLVILYYMEWLDDLKSALGIANRVDFIHPPGQH